jgi:hypothetical protein
LLSLTQDAYRIFQIDVITGISEKLCFFFKICFICFGKVYTLNLQQKERERERGSFIPP